jgi:hypothetical protein
MNKNFQSLLLILALLPAWASAQHASVQLLELDPPSGTTLSPGDLVYARLTYQSDIPLRFRLVGMVDGAQPEPVPTEFPILYPAGNGNAVTWVAYHDGMGINELRVIVMDENLDTIYSIPVVPLEMRWSADVKHRREPAEWTRLPPNSQPESIAATPAGVAYSVRILEFDPPPEATLSPGEPMYLRLAYQSDRPLRFQPTGLYKGKALVPEPSFSNPVFDPVTHVHPAGEREAITWFIYHGETAITELRLAVMDEHRQTLHTIPIPVRMNWSGKMYRPWRNPAEWARNLLAEQHGISADSPQEQPREDRAFAYTKWLYWVLQAAVVLIGVSLARWIESAPKRAGSRGDTAGAQYENILRRAGLTLRPQTGKPSVKYSSRGKSGGVVGQAKRGGRTAFRFTYSS